MHKAKSRFMAIVVVFMMILTPALAGATQSDQTVAEMAGGGAAFAGVTFIGWAALGTVAIISIGGVTFAFAVPQTRGSTKNVPAHH
ncbi:MAG: hypothetical protein V1816_22705 [Pseudomonadota bacterium]